MRTVIEKGQDADGFPAAAICRETDTQSSDRRVYAQFYVLPLLLLPVSLVFTPLVRARLWALAHGEGFLPVVDAAYVL